MRDPYIAVLPYGYSLGPQVAQMPLATLHWPLGVPGGLAGIVADLGPQDHLLVFPKTSMQLKWNWGTRAKISLLVVEPRVIHARHLRALRLTHRRFHRVFTHDAATLARLPNAQFLPAAVTWVPDYATLDFGKTAEVSLIASARRDTQGHQLRHDVVDALREEGLDVDVMGRGYAPFEQKHEGHAPYRFSVVIENVRADGYFTEKLIDALLCESIPIYWGAPDVDAHFDAGGLIACETLDEIMHAVRSSDSDRYDQMRPALMRAKTKAEGLRDYQVLAAKVLRSER